MNDFGYGSPLRSFGWIAARIFAPLAWLCDRVDAALWDEEES